MSKLNLGVLFFAIISLLFFSQCKLNKESVLIQDLFELRIYKFENKTQEAKMEEFLEKAFIPAMKRNNIQNIGVFKHLPEYQDSLKQIFVLYPIQASSQFGQISETIYQDSILQKEGDIYINTPYNAPLFERQELILLKPFKGMPFLRPSSLKDDRNDRVYELRSYESPSYSLLRNKIEMFNEGGEIELFEELGFNAVFYAEVLAGSRMPNLMYMTTFKNMESRDTLWKSFFESPQWKVLVDDPYYANNVSKVDIFFLTPTPYSDY